MDKRMTRIILQEEFENVSKEDEIKLREQGYEYITDTICEGQLWEKELHRIDELVGTYKYTLPKKQRAEIERE